LLAAIALHIDRTEIIEAGIWARIITMVSYQNDDRWDFGFFNNLGQDFKQFLVQVDQGIDIARPQIREFKLAVWTQDEFRMQSNIMQVNELWSGPLAIESSSLSELVIRSARGSLNCESYFSLFCTGVWEKVKVQRMDTTSLVAGVFQQFVSAVEVGVKY